MSLLAVGVSTTRTRATALNIALALAVTCYVVFFRDFSEFRVAFLTLMIVWSSSWCGVFLADMLLRRSRYDVPALLRPTGGAYWYRGGWNLVATGWFLAGVLASALFATSSIWTGPLTAWVDGGDLSIFAGLLVGGVGYYVHARAQGLGRTPGAGGAPARAEGAAPAERA
ncbi:cytosine permease [Geodermatophilus sp. CPCC 206100]|uniref:cytosine permease n=1 Tax=Geodermatophilus sp. CPCC 206100 TaxID=3020054 RepID=UPI003AFF62E0